MYSRLILFISSLVLLGCSIKEDRCECPCSLHLLFGGAQQAGLEMLESGYNVSWAVSDMWGDVIGSGSFSCDAFPDSYVLNVPRRDLMLVLFVREREDEDSDDGPRIFIDENHSMRIIEGRDCPSVYSFVQSVDCSTGDTALSVSFCRDYALLYCVLKGDSAPWAGAFYELKGNVNGYGADAKPLQGVFRYPLTFAQGGGRISLAGIPRQLDGSLHLEVSSSEYGSHRSFPLGEYIISSGYDWGDDVLGDIVIELDFSGSEIGIEIIGEENEVHLSYEISRAVEKCYLCTEKLF